MTLTHLKIQFNDFFLVIYKVVWPSLQSKFGTYWGRWLAQSVECATLNLGVVSSSPRLRVQRLLKNKKKWGCLCGPFGQVTGLLTGFIYSASCFQGSPMLCLYQYLAPSCCRVIFQHVATPRLVCAVTAHRQPGWSRCCEEYCDEHSRRSFE